MDCLRESEEPPAATAARKVAQETGLIVKETIQLLNSFADVGRPTNLSLLALVEGELGTTEIELSFVPAGEVARLAEENTIAIRANLGLLYLAGCHPRVRSRPG